MQQKNVLELMSEMLQENERNNNYCAETTEKENSNYISKFGDNDSFGNKPKVSYRLFYFFFIILKIRNLNLKQNKESQIKSQSLANKSSSSKLNILARTEKNDKVSKTRYVIFIS